MSERLSAAEIDQPGERLEVSPVSRVERQAAAYRIGAVAAFWTIARVLGFWG